MQLLAKCFQKNIILVQEWNVNITYVNNVDKTELVRRLQKEKLSTASKIRQT